MVHPNLQVDGTLVVDGTLFVPSGGTYTADELDVTVMKQNGSVVATEAYVVSAIDAIPDVIDATNSVKGIDYKGLLAEYTVTGNAVTSIDFSGLDINTHKSYRVEVDIYNSAGSQTNIYCFINNDTTLTNYYSQLLQGFAGSANGTNINNPIIAQVLNGQFSMAVCSINHLPLVVKPRVISSSSSYEGTALVSQQYSVCKTATVANITQLTFTSSVASAIGVGSKIRIYRGDV